MFAVAPLLLVFQGVLAVDLGAVSISVNPSSLLGPPLNPLVFGANCAFGTVPKDPAAPYPLCRYGGNAATRYNYVYDLSNHASDWFFLNEPGPGNTDVDWLDSLYQSNVSGLLTVTTVGFVACSGGIWGQGCNTKAPGFSVSKYGAQEATECSETGNASWCDRDAGNGVLTNGSNVVNNDPSDTSVPSINASFALGWLARLAALPSFAALRGILLDNEKTTYNELWNSIVAFAAPIRAAYPHLEIHGPQSWGWCAYWNSGVEDSQLYTASCTEGDDRRAHGDVPLTQWLVQQLAAYKAETGVALLTHLDVHAYPQANGVDSNSEDEATAGLRLRSPMMLYNESYVDESWIGQPVALLPRLRGWISNATGGEDLGLKLSLSEFSFGADSCVTAGVAHAETLAVLATAGVDEAMVWTAPAPGSPSAQAWGLALNYDGAGAGIRGAPVQAASADTPAAGAYGFLDGGDVLRVLLTGKAPPSAGAATAALTVQWPAGTAAGNVTARAFGFSHANPVLARLPDVTLRCGDGAPATLLVLPVWSATLLVLPYGAGACA